MNASRLSGLYRATTHAEKYKGDNSACSFQIMSPAQRRRSPFLKPRRETCSARLVTRLQNRCEACCSANCETKSTSAIHADRSCRPGTPLNISAFRDQRARHMGCRSPCCNSSSDNRPRAYPRTALAEDHRMRRMVSLLPNQFHFHRRTPLHPRTWRRRL